MTSFLTSLYLLSFKETEISHTEDINCIKTLNKSQCTQAQYSEERNEFFNSRTDKVKKNWAWKKKLKNVDKLFHSYKCIYVSWESNQPLRIFFSNGSIVSIKLNHNNNTLEKIDIDNNLVGKCISSRIVDVIITQNCMYITYCEPKLTLIHINRETSTFFLFHGLFGTKNEPRISHMDLIGPSSKNIERKLSLNSSKDCLLVWWKFCSDDVLPWSPVTFSADRINIVVYSINDGFEALCSIKTYGELIRANFSKQYSKRVLTIEKVRSKKEEDINICAYEIVGEQYHHIFVSKLPLRGDLLTCDWSTNEKLLASDSDQVLLIYDLKKKTSVVTNLLFLPKQIAWHPQSCIALVIGSENQLQCFDSALTCVKFQLFYKSYSEYNILNINSYLFQCSIQKALWQKSDFTSSCLFVLDSNLSSILILKFCTGNIIQNNLTAAELINQYLKSNSIDEAILLLRSLSWCHESELCFQCLTNITTYLFRKPFNLQTQSGLELALGTFYDNIDNFPKRIIKMYQRRLHHIARRFFHTLLRHYQFRKAFLLAVDLESQDLFLDIFHVARQKKENFLAVVALRKAEELDTSSDSCSCASSYTSKSGTSSNDKSEIFDNQITSCSNTFDLTSHQQYQLPVTNQSQLMEGWLNSCNNVGEIPQDLQSNHSMPSLISHPKLDTFFPSVSNEMSPVKICEANINLPSTSYSRSFSEILMSNTQSMQDFNHKILVDEESRKMSNLHEKHYTLPSKISLSASKNSRLIPSSGSETLSEFPTSSGKDFFEPVQNSILPYITEEQISVNQQEQCAISFNSEVHSVHENKLIYIPSSYFRPLPDLPLTNSRCSQKSDQIRDLEMTDEQNKIRQIQQMQCSVSSDSVLPNESKNKVKFNFASSYRQFPNFPLQNSICLQESPTILLPDVTDNQIKYTHPFYEQAGSDDRLVNIYKADLKLNFPHCSNSLQKFQLSSNYSQKFDSFNQSSTETRTSDRVDKQNKISEHIQKEHPIPFHSKSINYSKINLETYFTPTPRPLPKFPSNIARTLKEPLTPIIDTKPCENIQQHSKKPEENNAPLTSPSEMIEDTEEIENARIKLVHFGII